MIKIGPIELMLSPPWISFDGEEIYQVHPKKAAEILFYIEHGKRKEINVIKDMSVIVDPNFVLEVEVGGEKIHLDLGEKLQFKRWLEWVRDLPFLSELQRKNVKLLNIF